MNHTLRKHVATAAMLLAPLGAALVAQPAAAQSHRHYRVADQGRVTNMSVNSNAGLAPGATLRLQVYATPGARWASVALGGSGVRVPLHERARGEYVGTHVIARGERIDPRGLMTVRAGWGEGPVTIAFNYPPSFQSLAMGAGPAMGNAVVNEFAMWPRGDLAPGQVVHFRVEGTPHARAWVEVPDVTRGLALREVRRGVYMGSYTIRRHDHVDAFRDARVVLRSGHERVTARVSEGRNYGDNR